jgi:hypothetical protein
MGRGNATGKIKNLYYFTKWTKEKVNKRSFSGAFFQKGATFALSPGEAEKNAGARPSLPKAVGRSPDPNAGTNPGGKVGRQKSFSGSRLPARVPCASGTGSAPTEAEA